MSGLKEKAFWIAAGDIAGRGLSFATSIYLARSLGTEFFGLITVAIAALGYAAWFADLGLNSIGTRETAKDPAKRIYYVIEVFTLKIMLGFIVLGASALFIYFSDLSQTQKNVMLGFLISIIPYTALMEWFYAGKQEFGKIAFSKLLSGLSYFVLVFFFVQSAGDIEMVPPFYNAGICLAALFLGGYAFRDKAFKNKWRGFGIFLDLLKTSSVLGMGKFFSQLVQLLPPLLIGFLLSMNAAGLYGAAFRIVLLAMLVDRVFVNLLLPNLASLWSNNKQQAMLHLDNVFRFICVGGALIGMLTALLAQPVIQLFYGAEYAGSASILQVLSIFIAFTSINSLFSFGLIAMGKDNEYLAAMATGGIISVLVLFFLSLFKSAFIIAIGVVSAEIIITFSTFFYFRKTVMLSYAKPFILSFLFALLLFFLFIKAPFQPVINAVFAGALFLFLMLISGTLQTKHLIWFKEKAL